MQCKYVIFVNGGRANLSERGKRAGYNLGTLALKPHKQAIKSYQNDMVLAKKSNVKQDL